MRDKYPAYVSWETFEKIQAMLQDNYAEYSRNKTRGVPREGAALLHGIAYCGACGHKMVVQYKSGSRYICNYLRQQHGVPVCQYIPTNPVDAEAVAAFFKALAPAELDAFVQARAVRCAADEAALNVQAQQVERLRYRAALAERQFDQVDPDNRLVAAELERRWEETLRDLRQAEASLAAAGQDAGRVVPFVVGPDLQAAFAAVGRACRTCGPARPDHRPQEGAPALPHRQGCHPPRRPRHDRHAYCLARRRNERGHGARHGRLTRRSVAEPRDGSRHHRAGSRGRE